MSTATGGLELESVVGRYGTLMLGAFVILLGVGTLIVWAVQRGLLSPEVRVADGAVAGGCVGAAGLHFRRKGEVRYGNVLLALSLAMTDVVAWGAGPRLHIVPSGVALPVVDLVALALAALATQDGSEFLFGVAVAGALSAPFITTDGRGPRRRCSTYGAVVLLGGICARCAIRGGARLDPARRGRGVYARRGGDARRRRWYVPILDPAVRRRAARSGRSRSREPVWRGALARAFLAMALLGVLVGWDPIRSATGAAVAGERCGRALVTYAALLVRRPPQQLWTASALVLPLMSLGVASAAPTGAPRAALCSPVWTALALVAWRVRAAARRADARRRAPAAGDAARERRPSSALAQSAGARRRAGGVGRRAASLAEDEESPLPVIGVARGARRRGAVGDRSAREPAALRVHPVHDASERVGAASHCWAWRALADSGRRTGAPAQLADRAVRLGTVIAFAFMWGRMEMVHAFSRDARTFLLTRTTRRPEWRRSWRGDGSASRRSGSPGWWWRSMRRLRR